MIKTALASAGLALAGYACAAWLTHDFEVWTAEGARRLEVALQPVATPAVQVQGPAGPPQPLRQMLAGGQTVTILDFVYTRCQTLCLALGSTYQQMQASLQSARQTDMAARRVQLLTISFDSQRDDQQALADYAARLNADAAIWRLVRVPEPKDLAGLMADFQVIVVGSGQGDFEHNAALLVIDTHGRLVRIFDYADHQLALDYSRFLAAAGSP
ncbi:SCO family protein [Polaromonas sp. CG_9.11]|uniref:SCO family protein n=1 Tax=Polaromonas sp. CG_9.11 TaxID=2787730 RepID=UPI0018CB77C6|nr:SCO family protein [Polaromonas sp. CG_9.11]MBG6075263.1 protein SCO1/2 [Polaromonas sp. CG_9.11]